MSRFQPKGEHSQRDIIISAATVADFGDLLSYTKLGMLLNLTSNPADARRTVQAAVTAARPKLIREHGRALIAVNGKGYRVARPGEMAGVAQGHRKRADRQVNRALAVVTHADTSAMTDAEFQRFNATRVVITDLHRRMNTIEDRMTRLERAIFGDPPQPATGEVIEKQDEPPAPPVQPPQQPQRHRRGGVIRRS